MKDQDYKNTAALIGLVESFLMDLDDSHFEKERRLNGTYSPSSKKLAARIFLEWSKSLKKGGKQKDKKLSELLLGLVKYLE